MNVLGIESSCDETAAAVVRDGREVLSNCVFSQVREHAAFGGVVPEVAARMHLETLPGLLELSRRDAGQSWDEIDLVAVTYGPGLASSLLVGVSAARALSMRLARPLAAVNHLEAHLYSVFLADLQAPRPRDRTPEGGIQHLYASLGGSSMRVVRIRWREWTGTFASVSAD